MMKIPAIISAINGCAPRPTTKVNTPTDAISAAGSTPTTSNIKMMIAIAHPYLTKPSRRLNTVLSLSDYSILALKIIRKIQLIA